MQMNEVNVKLEFCRDQNSISTRDFFTKSCIDLCSIVKRDTPDVEVVKPRFDERMNQEAEKTSGWITESNCCAHVEASARLSSSTRHPATSGDREIEDRRLFIYLYGQLFGRTRLKSSRETSRPRENSQRRRHAFHTKLSSSCFCVRSRAALFLRESRARIMQLPFVACGKRVQLSVWNASKRRYPVGREFLRCFTRANRWTSLETRGKSSLKFHDAQSTRLCIWHFAVFYLHDAYIDIPVTFKNKIASSWYVARRRIFV